MKTMWSPSLKSRRVFNLSSLAYLLLTGILLAQQSALAAEWQELDSGTTRIERDKDVDADDQQPLPDTVPLPEGHYAPGEGTIDSAFGVEFGVTIPDTQIDQKIGWRPPPRFPEKPKYNGLVTPFQVESIALKPTLQPSELVEQGVQYTAWVDFDRVPIAVETSAFENADEVIDIIKRKYGEPDEVQDQIQIFKRDTRRLLIYPRSGNRAFLRYEDLAVLDAYIYERNLSLKRKYREDRTERLTPIEKEIVALARQLETFREEHGEAFGLPFGHRVGFRAAPDEFVEFEPPIPLKTFTYGDYRVMVSPDLMPIAVRFEVSGNEALLERTKLELELAMELAFAGFLKQTPHHTVLTFKQQAYSLLIRQGKFQFTVHDRHENEDRREREKAARIAAAEAKKEQERLAELKRQKAAIAARQQQIEEEKAF